MSDPQICKPPDGKSIHRKMAKRYLAAIIVGFLYIILLGIFTALFNNP